jgi:hypothetical protein
MIRILRSLFIRSLAVFIFPAGLLVCKSSCAQAKFSVICPDKIGRNEILDIKFRVENGSQVQNMVPPSFKGFNVVGGPNQETSMSNINGKVSQYVAIGYSLQPTALGNFTIGPATAYIDGREYHTQPVTVEVTKGSTQQSGNAGSGPSPFPNLNFDFPPMPLTHEFDDYILKPGENVAKKTQKNLFLKLDASKTSCYVGEPIEVSYKLYTRLRPETTITDAPSFNGFSVSDLDVNGNAALENYNGRQYNVYTLRRVELYPLQPGNITLDPVVADNKVTFIKSQYVSSQRNSDLFDMLENFGDAQIPASGLVEQHVTLKTPPLTITVRPLPLTDKPADFKGAVGDYEITASLEKDHFTTDDAGSLKVVVKGKGNIQLVNAPTVGWPKGVDGYDARVKDNVDKSKVPMRGSKTFTFPFTVSRAGEYKIDSITFSFFDPASGTYKTRRTPPLEMKVIRGSGVHRNPLMDTGPAGTEVKEAFFTGKTEWIAGILLVLGFIILLFFLFIRKGVSKDLLEKNIQIDDLKNEAGQEETKEFFIPENPLLDAHEKMMAQNSREFFSTLDASLKKYLSGKFKVPANELNKKRLNEELDKCNVSLGTTLMLSSLMDEVEINLYAPPSDVSHLHAVFEKASEVVSLLDKQVCSH